MDGIGRVCPAKLHKQSRGLIVVATYNSGVSTNVIELADLDLITRINLTDFFEAAGLAHSKMARALLEPFVRPAARRFAAKIVTFDHRVGLHGLQSGSTWLTQQMARTLLVAGQGHIAAHGPVIIASNHPGMTDTVALFGAIARADLKAVAAVRPFLAALGNVGAHLIDVSDDPAARLRAVRAVATHLRAGGSVVTFPAGAIEPDPLVLPGAIASLDNWAESLGLFARLVPGCQIVPAIVSGVVSHDALRSAFARVRRTQRDRERMAVTLQIILRRYQNVTVRVAFGAPLNAAQLLADGLDARGITRAVARAAGSLIETPPTDWAPVFG